MTEVITTQYSLLTMISQGDIWSRIILVFLLFMSIWSWSIIIRKWVLISLSSKSSRDFLQGIQPGDDIEDIYLRSHSFARAYTAVLFQQTHDSLSQKEGQWRLVQSKSLENNVERIVEKSILTSRAKIEKGLNWLATISSSAPFIGLLGTVLGIINSFYSIASKGASSLAVVAPGLSAALIATAAGLFAAIPALIAFNVFRNRVKTINDELIGFGLEIVSLIIKRVEADSRRKI